MYASQKYIEAGESSNGLSIHCVGVIINGWRLCAQVKHLNTLGVEQVAAAIHTQGLGLADNAVNAAYQFLARNFTLLSQVSQLNCPSVG